MFGSVPSVSTLLMIVGMPWRPETAGNGGLPLQALLLLHLILIETADGAQVEHRRLASRRKPHGQRLVSLTHRGFEMAELVQAAGLQDEDVGGALPGDPLGFLQFLQRLPDVPHLYLMLRPLHQAASLLHIRLLGREAGRGAALYIRRR